MSTLKYGRRPPKNHPALPFGSIVEAVVPAHPSTFDSISGWGGWDMLKNDAWGDCVAVTWATVRRIATRIAGQENYPGLDEVLTVYKTQNPDFNPNGSPYDNGPESSADGGMDIQTLLEHLVKVGGPDGVKALAFAKVDHTNLDEVKAALAVFNFLWLGVEVTQQNEDAFPDLPWDVTSYPVLGGHSITGTGYDLSVYKMETWADEGSLTARYLQHGVEEAWVVIWPEHAAHMSKEQRDALDQAYTQVTNGKHIVWPDPNPSPEPPKPSPDDELAAFVLQWLARVPRFYKGLQKALHQWLTDHGYTS